MALLKVWEVSSQMRSFAGFVAVATRSRTTPFRNPNYGFSHLHQLICFKEVFQGFFDDRELSRNITMGSVLNRFDKRV